MVVNRVLPELFGDREEAVFEALRRRPAPVALLRDGSAATSTGSSTAPLAVRDCGDRVLPTSPDWPPSCLRATPLLFVPELFTRAQGIRATRMVADALGDEVL